MFIYNGPAGLNGTTLRVEFKTYFVFYKTGPIDPNLISFITYNFESDFQKSIFR